MVRTFSIITSLLGLMFRVELGTKRSMFSGSIHEAAASDQSKAERSGTEFHRTYHVELN